MCVQTARQRYYACITASLNIMFVSLVLTFLSLYTSYWTVHRVDRSGLRQLLRANSTQMHSMLNSSIIYLDRNIGIFTICFPDGVPSDQVLADNDLQLTWQNCALLTIDYQVPASAGNTTADWTPEQWTRMHLMRSMACCLAAAAVTLVIAFLIGVAALCLADSELCSGLVYGSMVLSGVASVAGLVLYHYIEHMSKALPVQPHPGSWPYYLNRTTESSQGLSYMCYWAVLLLNGVCHALLWCALCAARHIRTHKSDLILANSHAYNHVYYMQRN